MRRRRGLRKIIRGDRKYEHIQQQTRRRMDESSEKEFARVVPSANSVCAYRGARSSLRYDRPR